MAAKRRLLYCAWVLLGLAVALPARYEFGEGLVLTLAGTCLSLAAITNVAAAFGAASNQRFLNALVAFIGLVCLAGGVTSIV